MNRLAHMLAKHIREKVLAATKGRSGTNLESRFIFHGPPIELLESVYTELTDCGGIQVSEDSNGSWVTLPVLLQYPSNQTSGPNPSIGASGKCDESHLLHIRNDPNCPSFVALVPPGQHNNRSVASTTDEFGMSASSNTGHSTFEEWWEDGFVQRLIAEGLQVAGLEQEMLDDARLLVQSAASSLDEVDKDEGSHKAAWRLLSRIYSISASSTELPPATALALACGVPPMQNAEITSKLQLAILGQIADVMADGFRTGVEQLLSGATTEVGDALNGLLSHLQASCEIPTAFERATEAFYLPADTLELKSPPSWWIALTTECWTGLLAEEPDATTGELSIECINAIVPVGRGMPAIVRDKVLLSISAASGETGLPIEVQLIGGSHGKTPFPILVEGTKSHQDLVPPGHKSPITYKAVAAGCKAATAKVISKVDPAVKTEKHRV